MKRLFSAAALAAALAIAPATADATVFYTVSGSFSTDTDGDTVNELYEWSFEFSTPDYLTTTGDITPTSCSITGSFYGCAATQFVDPNHSNFGGAIDDDFVSFQYSNLDGSGGGGSFYFFQGGAFGADGFYTNEGQPDPFGPTGDGGFVGNAGPATLLVRSDAVAAVPEPASWAMMIAGFGFVGAAMRRRQPVLKTA